MSKLPPHRVLPLTPTKPVFRPIRTLSSPQQRNSYRDDILNHELNIGDRVISHGHAGTIAFIGPTEFSTGEWIGIILDEPQGKNDGSVSGIRYFEADPNHGLFCRRDKIESIPLNDIARRNSSYHPSVLPVIEESNIASLATSTSTKKLQIGDRVTIRGTKFGTLQYIGKFHVNQGIWCGIKLDGPSGKHDGKVDGKRYFKCQHRHGIFAPLQSVEKIVNDMQDDLGEFKRQSIISVDSTDQFNEISSQDSNLSEISTSSNSWNRSPVRSSRNIRQPIFSRNINSMETSTSTTTEISGLIEKIQEKDTFIGKLKQDLQNDRLELHHSTEKIQTVKKDLATLQQKYDSKENQNKQLIQEQFHLKQRLENLQFQLEEYQDPVMKIIDDQQQLSFVNDLENYAETKEKLAQLESMNQNLLIEKEHLQNEIKQLNESKESEKQAKTYINELEKQIETLKYQINDFKTKEQIQTNRSNENETLYKYQILEYQSKIDQIIKQNQNNQLQLTQIEEEKRINDKQIQDQLNEIKRLKENVIPGLEEECEILKSELQNRDSTSHMTLQQRSAYYEQQIKEYENNLNQAMRETQTIQSELAKLEAEKIRHDNIFNSTIANLKQDYEKEYEILQNQLSELQNKNQTHNIILNERTGYYEIQLKEYQIKIDQQFREIESLRTELTNLREEKLSNEKQWDEMANKLTREYQTLQFELEERDRQQNSALNECEVHYQSKLKDLQTKHDQLLIEMEEFHSHSNKLNEEKTTIETRFNETIKTLQEDHKKQCKELQKEIDELNEREHNAHRTAHQHETEFEQHVQTYKNKIEQTNLESQRIQNQFVKVQEEKVQLNDTIDILKREIEKLKSQLLDRDRSQNTALEERDAYYELRMKENQIKREHDVHEIQVLRAEITNLQDEKLIHEKQSKERIEELEHKCDTLKKQCYELDQTQHMAMSEREIQYQFQIKDLQMKRDQSLVEIQNLQFQLNEIQQEKTISEDHLNQSITNLKQDYERQYKEFQIEINELNERERQAHKSVHQRETDFEQQITDYQDQLENSNLKNQLIQLELTKSQEEKNILDTTMNILKQEIEKLRMDLEERDQRQNTAVDEHEAYLQSQLTHLRDEKLTIENQFDSVNQEYERKTKEFHDQINELHERERATNLTLQQQIKTFETRLEEANLEIQNIQTELLTSQEEKLQLIDMNNSLKQNIERLERESQERDQTRSMAMNERELHYQSQVKELQTNKNQSDLERQNLQLQINNLTTTINTLKQDHLRKQQDLQSEIDDLNERERGINKALQQREIEIEQQIKDYKNKFQQMQNELSVLQEEKIKFNETNNVLKQTIERLERESQERDQTRSMAMNEREIHYQSQIKELQAKSDLSSTEIQKLQSQLNEVQKEKTSNEHKTNETIKSLNNQLENKQKQILEEYQLQNTQQMMDYEKKLEISAQELANLQDEKQSNEEILRNLMMSIQEEAEKEKETYKTQIMELEEKLDRKINENEYQSTSEKADKQLHTIENLTKINEQLQKEVNDLKTRMKEMTNSDVNQTTNDKRLNDLQQMYDDLLEKQTNTEQQHLQEQMKVMKEKIMEYETKLILSRNEYQVEMENMRLDHDQELLQLKRQLEEAKSTKKKKLF